GGPRGGLGGGGAIRKESQPLPPRDERQRVVADRLCERGRFGQKTGASWYRYPEGSRTPVPDPEVQALIEDCARRTGIVRRTIPSAEIVERTVYALVNEGAKILEEGIVRQAVDIDIVYIN